MSHRRQIRMAGIIKDQETTQRRVILRSQIQKAD